MKISLFLIAISITLFSCSKERIKGNGEIKTENRAITGFTQVEISGSTNVFITYGANFEVKVKAFSNLIPYLETKVKNGVLLIGYKSNSNIQNDNSEVYITMPNLYGLSTNGSGNISTAGTFAEAENFTASISGSGNINIEGGASNNFEIHISGSGDVKGFGLISQKVNISIEGSGDAEVSVVKNLKADIKGSGNVYYKGEPDYVNSQTSGSGQLIKK